MGAEKRSVSAPQKLFAQADVRQEQLGYSTFSDYIQALIRADVVAEASHVRDVAPGSSSASGPAVQLARQLASENVSASKVRHSKRAVGGKAGVAGSKVPAPKNVAK